MPNKYNYTNIGFALKTDEDRKAIKILKQNNVNVSEFCRKSIKAYAEKLLRLEHHE